jgi:hypothetical protein
MGTEDNMDLDSKVQLTRIEGKLDLVNERHETMKGDIGKLEERQVADTRRIDERLHSHGSRIGVLEADKHLRQGERAGLALSAKAIHWIGGGSVVAVLAAVLRHFAV